MGALYCWPDLPRAGLGNRLIPWARCEVFAHVNGATMVQPRWSRWAFGPLLRGERDLRFYRGQFERAGIKNSIRRVMLTLGGRKVRDPDDLVLSSRDRERGGRFIFSSYETFFRDLASYRDLLGRRLNEVVRQDIQRRVEGIQNLQVVMHVRRGDFRDSVRTPCEWYEGMLLAIRNTVGTHVRGAVFSDASDGELANLLQIPGVSRVETGSAIGDILSLSKGRVLLASGYSSFSSWASFLGGMPTASAPDQDMVRHFSLSPVSDEYVVTMETPTALSDTFRNACMRSIDGISLRPFGS